MEFNPNNPVVKLCMEGMAMEEKDKPREAATIFLQAWSEAITDFEKFLSSHYLYRHQNTLPSRLKWIETALEYALKINDDSVISALPSLYSKLAGCYEDLGDFDKAKKSHEIANSFREKPSDKGPFYHGTKADLKDGDLLTPGGASNYKPELLMNHIYFTALPHGAGLAAALAKGEGHERVYIVKPTGSFENDPNVTDKKFPGNPTRSYRSTAPLMIVGELSDWVRTTPAELRKWRERLAQNKGEIIN